MHKRSLIDYPRPGGPRTLVFDYGRIEISAKPRYVEWHGRALTITSNLRLEQLPPTSVNHVCQAAPVRHSFTTDA